jgi:prepilin-type N-terminal cleavage/methylation domain-containing protein
MSASAQSAPSRPHVAAPTPSAGEAGFTLIEVIVSALIVALVSTVAATAFISSLDSSGNQRARAEAQALAEQNQDRRRGLTVDELSNLDQTLPAVSLNGTQFTVQETANYISDASGTPSCTNPSADYLKTTSTVTWANMGSEPPVTVSSVLTPTIGSVDPSHGSLAISADGAGGAGIAGMNIALSGTASASGTTSANGCVLFGDLPAGTYTVSASPISGIYVDGLSGQAVTPAQPDTTTAQVTAGSKSSASASFDLDQGGTANVSFTDLFPVGVSPSPLPAASAPAVVLANSAMNAPSYRLCSGADTICPAVGAGDTSFAASAWSTTLAATPLFPNTYAAYAGVCTSDAPSVNGGTNESVIITRGAGAGIAVQLPAIVIRIMSGTNEIPLPARASLVLTDTGCNMNYIAPAPATLSAGQATLQLNAAYGTGTSDTGILANPGMPYGRYQVCYQSPARRSYTTTAFGNTGNGEIISIPTASATSGTACP